jgi:hypothetical protein
MKKQLTVVALSLGLASAAPAFANEEADREKITPKNQPVKMTDQQLDEVAGGQLVTVVLFDVVDVEDNQILNNVVVAAQAQVGILAAQAANQRFENVRQVTRD